MTDKKNTNKTEEINVEETTQDQVNTENKPKCCGLNKNTKIIVIVIAILIAIGLIYRVNAYMKYKKAQKQLKTIEKQSMELQKNMMDMTEKMQKDL